MRPKAKACMKPSRPSITFGGPSVPCSASSAACMPSRDACPACSRLMSPPPATKANRPGRARRRDAERVGELLRVQAAQLAGRHRGAERPDRAGRMEAALAQVRRAGAGQADVGLVARDDRLDQRAARGVPVVGDARAPPARRRSRNAPSRGGSRRRARCRAPRCRRETPRRAGRRAARGRAPGFCRPAAPP